MNGIRRALGDVRRLRWGGSRGLRTAGSVLLVAIGLGLGGRSAWAQWAAPERVSVPDRGIAVGTRVTGNGESDSPRVSRDGRFVVFASSASDLVTNDVNGVRRDVFLREVATGQTTLISVTSDGRSGNGDSFAPEVSADGRWVVFASRASDLVPGDGNGVADVFVRDRVDGRTFRVSVASDGTEADADSFGPCLTPDGQRVVFASRAGNLDTARADRDERVDVFLYRVETGTTVLVSGEARDGTGNEQDIDDYAVSDDGLWVAFSTVSTNVVEGATQRMPLGAYVRDVAGGRTIRLETTLGPASLVRATAEARTLVFAPGRARLAVGTWVATTTSNGSNVVEVVDLSAEGATFVGGAVGWGGTLLDEPTSLSFDATGEALALTQSLAPSQPAVLRVWREGIGVVTPTNALTQAPVRAREVALSPAGDRVVFTSPATNLVAAGTPARQVHLYRVELTTGEVRLMLPRTGDAPAGGVEYGRPGFLSQNAVVFQSASDAWSPGDGNRSADVFLGAVASGSVEVISARTGGGAGAPGGGRLVSMESVSTEGRRVLFASLSDDLGAEDARGQVDLWVRDLVDGRSLLVTPPGAEGGPSRPGFGEAVLSANGRHVAFTGDLLVTRPDGSRVWTPQVFVRDVALGRSRTVALNPDGQPATMRTVSQLQISADGRYIAFLTDATTLVEGSGSRGQVILRDLVAQKTWLVATRGAAGLSISLAGWGGRVLVVQGGAAEVPVGLFDPATGQRVDLGEPVGVTARLSYDGQRVVVVSSGDGAATPGRVRWRDAGGSLIREVTLPPEAQGSSLLAALSRDGRWAAVRTGSAGTGWAIWRVDGETGQAARVEGGAAGSLVWGTSARDPSVSADGRWLAFESVLSGWADGDANSVGDIWVRDGSTQETRRVERHRDGAWETDPALRPVLSSDARRLVFMSRSGAFAAGDDNGVGDVFSVELGAAAPEDQDGDGLGDLWERAWFGNLTRDGSADDDGDGATALDEYRAGTSPGDDLQRPGAAGVSLVLEQEPSGEWFLRWRAEAGRRYQVQASTAVAGAPWAGEGEALVGTGETVRVGVPVSREGARFYRVAMEP